MMIGEDSLQFTHRPGSPMILNSGRSLSPGHPLA